MTTAAGILLVVFEPVLDCLGRLFFFEKDESVEDHEMRLAERARVGVEEREEPERGGLAALLRCLLLPGAVFLEDDGSDWSAAVVARLLGLLDDGDTDFLAEERGSAPLLDK